MKRFQPAALLAAFLIAACWSAPSAAQDWPSRRILLLVGYAAGGPVDIAARLFAERLRDNINQPVVVETKPRKPSRSSRAKSGGVDEDELGLVAAK